jgi:hypothetical protein
MLLTLLCAGEAKAGDLPPVLDLENLATCTSYTYAVTSMQVLNSGAMGYDAYFSADANGGDVTWQYQTTSTCPGSDDGLGNITSTCIGYSISISGGVIPSSPVVDSTHVNATGTQSGSTGQTLIMRASGDLGAGTVNCDADFLYHVTSSGGGWGDPHLTTVDGVHYDFQSAGEFTALRGDKVEIQTRQSPVPTAKVPITNEYTGITHCVAIYTAVAAKFGSTRVTLQPKPGAEPDPNSMLLRVNGKPGVLRAGRRRGCRWTLRGRRRPRGSGSGRIDRGRRGV